jgi:hypothetical protein
VNNAPNNKGTYQIITPPNALKARVGGGLGVDRQLAEKAGTAVDILQADFLSRVAAAIGEIAARMTITERSEDDDADHAAGIFRISQDLQIQGAAFDYPLVSDICASLCSCVESFDAPADTAGELVRAHTDALQLVIDHAIEGDGGYAGLDLVESLTKLVNQARR